MPKKKKRKYTKRDPAAWGADAVAGAQPPRRKGELYPKLVKDAASAQPQEPPKKKGALLQRLIDAEAKSWPEGTFWLVLADGGDSPTREETEETARTVAKGLALSTGRDVHVFVRVTTYGMAPVEK